MILRAWLVMVGLALVLGAWPNEAESQTRKRNKRQKKAERAAKDQAESTAPKPPAEAPGEAPPAALGAGDNATGDLDIERVLAHAKALSLEIGARPANSPEATRAAEYILGELNALGLTVEQQEVGTQVAPAIDLGVLYQAEKKPFTTSDTNIIVRFAPQAYSKDDPILFMAHYDSVWSSPGAIDNAVSVGLLIELARQLNSIPPKRRVILAWTAAEENGLIGSLALAESLWEEVGLAVSLDLVGGEGDLTLNGLSSLIGRGWLMWLAEVGKQAKVDVRAPWRHRVVSQLFPEIERSDHGSFTARGVAAIHLYHRSEGGVFLPYHNGHDTMSAVDQSSVEEAARYINMMTQTSYAFPKTGGNQGLWVPFPGGAKISSALAAQALEVMFIFFGIMSMMKLSRAAKESATQPVPSEGRSLGLAAFMLAYVLIFLVAGLLLGIATSNEGHPVPWIHGPSRFVLAALILAAALGYGMRALSLRLGSWKGANRYLFAAISISGLLGFFLLAFSIFELAWIFLLPCALFGGIGRVESRLKALLLLALAALPLFGPLGSSFLREAVFNSFYPLGLPIVAYIAFFALPYALAIVFITKRWPLAMPHENKALAGVAIVIAIALVTAATGPSPCSAKEYELRGLSCEIS